MIKIEPGFVPKTDEEREEWNNLTKNMNSMDYASLCFQNIEGNLYEFNKIYDINYESLKNRIIKRKAEIGNADFDLDIDDVYMVHSTNYFPDDFCYSSYSRLGGYFKNFNPLFYSNDFESNGVVMPFYRDTVHFSLNGLVSNTNVMRDDDKQQNRFTDRPCVIIEPLANHYNEKIASINPVDTVMDVGEEDEEISKDAIFIIAKDLYNELDEEKKKKLETYKRVVLFDRNIRVDRRVTPLQEVTDFVLCSMGILPQHTVAQVTMHTESYQHYYNDEFNRIQVKDLSDKDYLTKFTDLMERLNQEKLGVSYYNLPPEIEELRSVFLTKVYGYLHADLPQKKREIEENKKLFEDCYIRYINFLNERIGFPEEYYNHMLSVIPEYVANLCDNDFGYASSKISNEWKRYATEEEIKKLTLEYNEMEKERIKKETQQKRMMKELAKEQEEENDTVRKR